MTDAEYLTRLGQLAEKYYSLQADNALLRRALEDALSDCDTDEWRLAVVNAKAALARTPEAKP